MICPNCRGEVPDTARVCGYCGTKLSVAPAVPALERPRPQQEVLVREAPVPATPVREARKAKPDRQGFDWRWLVLALIVAAIAAVILWQLDVFGDHGDATTTTAVPTTTTAVPTTTTTAGFALPSEVIRLLNDPRITYEADFSNPPAEWEYNPSLVSFGDNGAEFRSDGTFARLQRARGASTGRAVLLGLHWDSPVFNVMLEEGEWLQPGFRRWGVIVSEDIRQETITDDASVTQEILPSGFVDGKWWFLLGQDGSTFFVEVWPDGRASGLSGYSERLGTTWASSALRFIVENPGGTVTIEDYWELDFTSYLGQ